MLGPSGSGKTILLNVIGGLDHYDEGDLIIRNISTKGYSARDWDSYRNHSIGFIFQSYYISQHQSVLPNVEMALNISGVSGKKRRAMAARALEQVGRKEHILKRPSQLSGGQMQRVAIFSCMPQEESLYVDRYDVKAGRWLETGNKCALVLASNGQISDYLLFSLVGTTIQKAADSEILKAQIEHPDVDIFTGIPCEERNQTVDLEPSSIVNVDSQEIRDAILIDSDFACVPKIVAESAGKSITSKNSGGLLWTIQKSRFI